MPEYMIKFRNHYKEKIENWWTDFNNLTIEEKTIIKPIIEKQEFDTNIDSTNIMKVLSYYKQGGYDRCSPQEQPYIVKRL